MHKKPADLQDRKMRDNRGLSTGLQHFHHPYDPAGSGGMKYLYMWSNDARKDKRLKL